MRFVLVAAELEGGFLEAITLAKLFAFCHRFVLSMPLAIPSQDFAFFCDEAGISTDRFTVVGGLCMHKNTIQKVQENMGAFRETFNMTRELKWSKITDQKQTEYMCLVEYFFAMNNVNHCQFHAIVFDNHKWLHKKFNDGDADIGLSKLYYQILHHRFCKTCGPHGSLYVRVDKRNSSTSLEYASGLSRRRL